MTESDFNRLESKLDRIIDALPTIDALGAVLVRRRTAIDRTGIHRNTLNGHEAFEGIGERKTYIEIAEIPVVKQRKKSKK